MKMQILIVSMTSLRLRSEPARCPVEIFAPLIGRRKLAIKHESSVMLAWILKWPNQRDNWAKSDAGGRILACCVRSFCWRCKLGIANKSNSRRGTKKVFACLKSQKIVRNRKTSNGRVAVLFACSLFQMSKLINISLSALIFKFHR